MEARTAISCLRVNANLTKHTDNLIGDNMIQLRCNFSKDSELVLLRKMAQSLGLVQTGQVAWKAYYRTIKFVSGDANATLANDNAPVTTLAKNQFSLRSLAFAVRMLSHVICR